MGPKRRRRQHGFTLLELLLTLGVTTIGLVGLLSLHISIARGNDSASRAAEATQIANATIESLRSQSRDAMVATLTGNPALLPPIDVNLVDVVGRAGMTFRRRCTVQLVPGGTVNLWRLRVEVGWTEDGAAAGAEGGRLDHLFAVEAMRTEDSW